MDGGGGIWIPEMTAKFQGLEGQEMLTRPICAHVLD